MQYMSNFSSFGLRFITIIPSFHISKLSVILHFLYVVVVVIVVVIIEELQCINI